jgi:2',3'-cyclic-nucleotide 2'-phosphodiesterase (5'-nucleotidase family)
MLAIAMVALGVVLVTVGCSEREQELTIAFSNDMAGEIRSCGCASHDYGGLGRRATYVEGLRKRSEDFLLFEGGDFIGVDINYSAQKARLTMAAMSYMGYDGIVVGEKDFVHGLDYLVETVNGLGLPVVVSNLFDTTTDELVFPPARVVELPSGLKVGVIGVMDKELAFPDAVPAGRLRLDGPKAAVGRELGSMRDEVDLVVVLAHIPSARARRLAQGLSGVDIVVTGHGARVMRKAKRFGDAYLLTTSDRGRFMGAAWATVDPKNGIVDLVTGHQALTPEYTDHEGIVKLFQAYDLEIARFERGRTTKLVTDPYAGAEACKPCHLDIHEQWVGTKHAHAFEILASRGREFDRDCTPCHTTGFYELGGFSTAADTPELKDIQCEACHGNGSAHTRTPVIKTPGNARAACTGCHTKEQTPDFSFSTYWPQIAH